jgi:hypothetical protein
MKEATKICVFGLSPGHLWIKTKINLGNISCKDFAGGIIF